MAQRKTLTQAQLDLLQWVEDGCPDGVYEGFDHRISAAALRRRGLVETCGHGATWQGTITDAGREYLRTSKQPGADPPRQANVSVTEELIRDVEAAGGVLRVRQEHGPGSIDWKARVGAAVGRGKVPAGKKLALRRSEDGFEISLEDLAPGLEPRPISVPVPERVRRYHPVAKRFRADLEHLEVSPAQLDRASRILHALALVAEERGWKVRNVEAEDVSRRAVRSNASRGHLLVSVGEFSQAIRIREEGFSGRPGPAEGQDETATGRLAISLVPSLGGRRWADRKGWTLEEKLPEVISEIETSAAAELHRQEEAERARERRRREWEAAMDAAMEKYLEAWRASRLIGRAETWQEIEGIRAYCDAVEARYPPDLNPEVAEWVSWARSYIERIDPLGEAPSMPADPENVRGEDLRPYLGPWSPYGPDPRRR